VKNNAAEWGILHFERFAIDRSSPLSSKKGGNMRKLFALVVLTGCLAAPSFARDVVAHSVKVAGKDSGKAVAVTAKGTVKGVAAVGKFLF
jgi:hypothetical protein